MTKQEQIEEIVYGSLITSTKCYNCIHFPLCFAQKGGANLELASENDCCYYQSKLPEDSVVLSREELSKEPYNDFCKGCPNVRVRSSGMTDCCADYSCEQFQKYARLIELYEQSRKETAEKILNELIDSSNKITFFDCRMALDLDKLAKKYGVEIKE